MDLTETMKQVLAKVSGNAQGLMGSNNPAAVALLQQAQHHAQQQQQQAQQQQQKNHPNEMQSNNPPYVTEKLYMLLQLYLQNKGWNPSIELLQAFSELKDSAMLPSAAYLQVLANRLSLDGQGRLVLRESGKIVLPYEHFANAVMLKHMSGPHGLHLGLEATIRSVMESYTVGRDNFGMEKEFIIEVVQSCPNPACRYYKTHLGAGVPPFMDAAFQSGQSNVDFMQHLPQPPIMGQKNVPSSQSSANASNAPIIDITQLESNNAALMINSKQQQMTNATAQLQQQRAALSAAEKHLKMGPNQSPQITAAILQQQNRAIAQQNLEKFNNLSNIEKQRMFKQFDKKQFDSPLLHSDNRAMERNIQPPPRLPSRSQQMSSNNPLDLQQSTKPQIPLKAQQPPQHNGAWGPYQAQQSLQSLPNRSDVNQSQSSPYSNMNARQSKTPQPSQSISIPPAHSQPQVQAPLQAPQTFQMPSQQQQQQQQQQQTTIGQENVVRVFDELMKNIARMKMFVRPSMCKPYGKQSESLQKTLIDTIQIVQSLRNCIPAPTIPISSSAWKSDDRNTGYPDFEGHNETYR